MGKTVRMRAVSRNSKELELYLHIPFCVKKCDYCDFLSGPWDRETRRRYVQALIGEIGALGKKYGSQEREIRSVFFGGGTPSLLTGDEIAGLMDCLCENFSIKEGTEITMEANPGTLTAENLEKYKQSGVNRLSLGCQSMNDEELRMLGRIHTVREFLESYDMARNAGFENLNVDLMSAIPGQQVRDWERNLKKVAELGPEHISAYSLIVEEGTPFSRRKLDLPDEDSERRMYEMTGEILREYGYHPYEISNYARSGRECIHNVGYWKRISYLGMGLGAASLIDGNLRYQNTCVMEEYLRDSVDPKKLFREEQILSSQEEMEEFMFLGLRMTEGIREEDFSEYFGCSIDKIYGEKIEKHQKLGLLERKDGRVRLTRRGISVSNQVFVDFLLD